MEVLPSALVTVMVSLTNSPPGTNHVAMAERRIREKTIVKVWGIFMFLYFMFPNRSDIDLCVMSRLFGIIFRVVPYFHVHFLLS